MRVACLLVPDFQVAAELARRPELAGKSLVIGGLPHERKYVVSRSPEAAAFGVAVGMSLRQARGLCPESVFLPSDDLYYRATFARILELLDGFSPRVEPESAGTAYLEADGLELLFGPEEELGRRIVAAVEEGTGLRPRVGIGGGKFVALQAAAAASSGTALVVSEGEAKAFLSARPVEQLPCSAETLRRLRLLGLRTLGQLAALSAGAMAEQFGPEGVEAYRLARGIDERQVVARELPLLLEESMEMDPPVDSSEALLAVAELLAKRLEARLQASYLACSQVDLQLVSSAGAASVSTLLHQPTASHTVLLDAVKRLVARLVTGGAANGPEPGSRAGVYPPPPDTGYRSDTALPEDVFQGTAQAVSDVGRRGVNPRPTSETPCAPIEKGAPTGQGEAPIARAPYFSHLKPRELAQLLEDAESGIDSVGRGPVPRRPMLAIGAARPSPATFSTDRPGRLPSLRGGAERPALHPIPVHGFQPQESMGPGSEAAGISLIRIALSGFGGEQGEQMELFRSRARSLRRLKQALSAMEEQFGEGIVRSLEEVERERPPAFPLEVAVDPAGQPEALRLRGRPEAITALCNRWRVEEEWWRRGRTRDYHRLISEDGHLCLLFRERVAELKSGWFLERVYE